MPALFPTRRSDGSFCVRVTVRVATEAPDDLASRFAQWSREWVKDNEMWDWLKDRRLNYFDDFEGPPRQVTSDSSHLSFILDGKASARWWKDWIAFRLLKDAQEMFPEILGVERVVDCPTTNTDQ